MKSFIQHASCKIEWEYKLAKLDIKLQWKTCLLVCWISQLSFNYIKNTHPCLIKHSDCCCSRITSIYERNLLSLLVFFQGKLQKPSKVIITSQIRIYKLNMFLFQVVTHWYINCLIIKYVLLSCGLIYMYRWNATNDDYLKENNAY